MRTLFVLIAFQFFSGFYNIVGASTIEVNTKSCNYNIIVPEGWDTIPSDTLTNRFGKGLFDIGLYDSKSKSYFDGRYIQYVFMPTLNSLNQYTFAQIYKELQNSIEVSNKQPQTGQIRLITDTIKADRDNLLLFITGKIISETKERNFAQIILPTKFGFLKIMRYEARGEQSINTAYNDLLASVNIPDNFKYTEPTSRFNLNIWHVMIAFAIGMAAYFGIQYAPKIKQLVTKK
ncbi:MAG: hypothetical protein JEZ09_18215 [Salinivirgaceae bacterium]|nr:hypothetical protein [Salinivirgaceae bacterium]